MPVLRRVGIALVALVLTLTLFAGSALRAHDFWLQASRFHVAVGESVDLRFMVGDGPDRGPWELLWRKVVALRDHGPEGIADLQSFISPTEGERQANARFTATDEGTHIIAFETTPAMSDLPADRFNPYLEHEGLTAVIRHRQEHGQTLANGRELYARRAKLLLQVGTMLTDNVTRPIGLSLEIVPESNPYALAPGTPLSLRILFRGRPLSGAGVHLARLDGPEGVEVPALSDANGRVTFAMPDSGIWRISTTWSEPTTHPDAEYDTLFSSLTFGRE